MSAPLGAYPRPSTAALSRHRAVSIYDHPLPPSAKTCRRRVNVTRCGFRWPQLPARSKVESEVSFPAKTGLRYVDNHTNERNHP